MAYPPLDIPRAPRIAAHALRSCVVLAVLMFGAANAVYADPVTFGVNVNTSSIPANTNGFLSLQFNRGGAAAQAATATVLNFASNGTLAPTADNTGGASGTLPNQLTINNSSADANEVFQGFTFGTTLGFDVRLSGAAVDNPANGSFGSAFSLLLFDADGNPLLSNDPNGVLFTILINPNGTTQVQNFGSVPGAVVVTQQVQAVPEPATMLLFGTGLAGIAASTKRRRAARART